MKRIMIAALLMVPVPAMAADTVEDNGNEILEMCTDSLDFMKGICLGYIRGASSAGDSWMLSMNRHLCRPTGVTVGQIQDVVVRYIRQHPESRHEAAVTLVMKAQDAAWPCSRT